MLSNFSFSSDFSTTLYILNSNAVQLTSVGILGATAPIIDASSVSASAMNVMGVPGGKFDISNAAIIIQDFGGVQSVPNLKILNVAANNISVTNSNSIVIERAAPSGNIAITNSGDISISALAQSIVKFISLDNVRNVNFSSNISVVNDVSTGLLVSNCSDLSIPFGFSVSAPDAVRIHDSQNITASSININGKSGSLIIFDTVHIDGINATGRTNLILDDVNMTELFINNSRNVQAINFSQATMQGITISGGSTDIAISAASMSIDHLVLQGLSSPSISFSGISINGSGAAALTINNVANYTLDDGIVIGGNADVGLWITGASHGIVSHNAEISAKNIAVFVESVFNPLVSSVLIDNPYIGNATAAVRISGSNNVVISNIVAQSSIGGVELSNSRDLVVSGKVETNINFLLLEAVSDIELIRLNINSNLAVGAAVVLNDIANVLLDDWTIGGTAPIGILISGSLTNNISINNLTVSCSDTAVSLVGLSNASANIVSINGLIANPTVTAINIANKSKGISISNIRSATGTTLGAISIFDSSNIVLSNTGVTAFAASTFNQANGIIVEGLNFSGDLSLINGSQNIDLTDLTLAAGIIIDSSLNIKGTNIMTEAIGSFEVQTADVIGIYAQSMRNSHSLALSINSINLSRTASIILDDCQGVSVTGINAPNGFAAITLSNNSQNITITATVPTNVYSVTLGDSNHITIGNIILNSSTTDVANFTISNVHSLHFVDSFQILGSAPIGLLIENSTDILAADVSINGVAGGYISVFTPANPGIIVKNINAQISAGKKNLVIRAESANFVTGADNALIIDNSKYIDIITGSNCVFSGASSVTDSNSIALINAIFASSAPKALSISNSININLQDVSVVSLTDSAISALSITDSHLTITGSTIGATTSGILIAGSSIVTGNTLNIMRESDAVNIIGLTNVTLLNPPAGYTAINIIELAKATLSNLTISNAATAININGGGAIDLSAITLPTPSGIVVTNSTSSVHIDNRGNNSAFGASTITGSDNITLSNLLFSSSAQDALSIFHSTNINLTSTVVTSSSASALSITDSNLTITDISTAGTAATGISVLGNSNVTATNITINNAIDGILIQNNASGLVSLNAIVFKNNTGAGVKIVDSGFSNVSAPSITIHNVTTGAGSTMTKAFWLYNSTASIDAVTLTTVPTLMELGSATNGNTLPVILSSATITNKSAGTPAIVLRNDISNLIVRDVTISDMKNDSFATLSGSGSSVVSNVLFEKLTLANASSIVNVGSGLGSLGFVIQLSTLNNITSVLNYNGGVGTALTNIQILSNSLSGSGASANVAQINQAVPITLMNISNNTSIDNFANVIYLQGSGNGTASAINLTGNVFHRISNSVIDVLYGGAINNLNISSNTYAADFNTNIVRIETSSANRTYSNFIISGAPNNTGKAALYLSSSNLVLNGVTIGGAADIGILATGNMINTVVTNVDSTVTGTAVYIRDVTTLQGGTSFNFEVDGIVLKSGSFAVQTDNAKYSSVLHITSPQPIIGGIALRNNSQNITVAATVPVDTNSIAIDASHSILIENINLRSSLSVGAALTLSNVDSLHFADGFVISGTAPIGLLINQGSRDIVMLNATIQATDTAVVIDGLTANPVIGQSNVNIDGLKILGAPPQAVKVLGGSKAVKVTGITGSNLGAITVTNSGAMGYPVELSSVGTFAASSITNSVAVNLSGMTFAAATGTALTIGGGSNNVTLNAISTGGTAATGILINGGNNIVASSVTLGNKGAGMLINSAANNVTFDGIALNGVASYGIVVDGAGSPLGNGNPGIQFSNITGTGAGSAVLDIKNNSCVAVDSVNTTGIDRIMDIESNASKITVNNVTMSGISSTGTSAFKLIGNVSNVTISDVSVSGSIAGFDIIQALDASQYSAISLSKISAQSAIRYVAMFSGTTKLQASSITNSKLNNGVKAALYIHSSAISSDNVTIGDNQVNVISGAHAFANSGPNALVVLSSAGSTGTGALLDSFYILGNTVTGAPVIFSEYAISDSAYKKPTISNLSITNNTFAAVDSAVVLLGSANINVLLIDHNTYTALTAPIIATYGVSNIRTYSGINISDAPNVIGVPSLLIRDTSNLSVSNSSFTGNGDIGIKVGGATSLTSLNNVTVAVNSATGTAISIVDNIAVQSGSNTNLSVNGLILGASNVSMAINNSRDLTIANVTPIVPSTVLGSIVINGNSSKISLTNPASNTVFKTSVMDNAHTVSMSRISFSSASGNDLTISNASSAISLANCVFSGTPSNAIFVDSSSDISGTGLTMFGTAGGSFDIATQSTKGISISNLGPQRTAGLNNLKVSNISLAANSATTLSSSNSIELSNMSKATGATKLGMLSIGASKNIIINFPTAVSFDSIAIQNVSNPSIQLTGVNVSSALATGSAVLIQNVNGAFALEPGMIVASTTATAITIDNSYNVEAATIVVNGASGSFSVGKSGAPFIAVKNLNDNTLKNLVVTNIAINNNSVDSIQIDNSKRIDVTNLSLSSIPKLGAIYVTGNSSAINIASASPIDANSVTLSSVSNIQTTNINVNSSLTSGSAFTISDVSAYTLPSNLVIIGSAPIGLNISGSLTTGITGSGFSVSASNTAIQVVGLSNNVILLGDKVSNINFTGPKINGATTAIGIIGGSGGIAITGIQPISGVSKLGAISISNSGSVSPILLSSTATFGASSVSSSSDISLSGMTFDSASGIALAINATNITLSSISTSGNAAAGILIDAGSSVAGSAITLGNAHNGMVVQNTNKQVSFDGIIFNGVGEIGVTVYNSGTSGSPASLKNISNAGSVKPTTAFFIYGPSTGVSTVNISGVTLSGVERLAQIGSSALDGHDVVTFNNVNITGKVTATSVVELTASVGNLTMNNINVSGGGVLINNTAGAGLITLTNSTFSGFASIISCTGDASSVAESIIDSVTVTDTQSMFSSTAASVSNLQILNSAFTGKGPNSNLIAFSKNTQVDTIQVTSNTISNVGNVASFTGTTASAATVNDIFIFSNTINNVQNSVLYYEQSSDLDEVYIAHNTYTGGQVEIAKFGPNDAVRTYSGITVQESMGAVASVTLNNTANLTIEGLIIESEALGIEARGVSMTQINVMNNRTAGTAVRVVDSNATTGAYNFNISEMYVLSAALSFDILRSSRVNVEDVFTNASLAIGGISLADTSDISIDFGGDLGGSRTTKVIRSLSLNNAVDTTLSAIALVASSADDVALTLANTHGFSINDFTISGAAQTGILITGSCTGITATNLVVESANTGIAIRGVPYSGMTNIKIDGFSSNAADTLIDVSDSHGININGINYDASLNFDETTFGVPVFGGISVSNSGIVSITSAGIMNVNYLSIDSTPDLVLDPSRLAIYSTRAGAALSLINTNFDAAAGFKIIGTATTALHLSGASTFTGTNIILESTTNGIVLENLPNSASRNVNIQGVTLNAAVDAIRISNSNDVTIQGIASGAGGGLGKIGGVSVVNSDDIIIHSAVFSMPINYIAIDQSTLVNLNLNGFAVDSDLVAGAAIFLKDIVGFDLTGIPVTGTAHTGIHISGGANITGNNLAIQAADTGILIQDISAPSSVSFNNVTLDVTESAIIIQNTDYVSIVGLHSTPAVLGGISLVNANFATITSADTININYLNLDDAYNRNISASIINIDSHSQSMPALSLRNISDFNLSGRTIYGAAATGLRIAGTGTKIDATGIVINASTTAIEIDSVDEALGVGQYNVSLDDVTINTIVNAVEVTNSVNVSISNLKKATGVTGSIGGISFVGSEEVSISAASTTDLQYLELNHSKNVAFNNFRIVSSVLSGAALSLINMDGAIFDGIDILGTASTGVYVSGTSRNITLENMKIQATSIPISIESLTNVNAPGVVNLSINNVTIPNTPVAIQIINASRDVKISNVIAASGTALGGIIVNDSGFISISSAPASTMTYSYADMLNANDVSLSNIKLSGANNSVALSIVGGSAITATATTISGSATAGVAINSSFGVAINGATLNNTGTYGVSVNTSDNVTLTNVAVNGISGTGFSINYSGTIRPDLTLGITVKGATVGATKPAQMFAISNSAVFVDELSLSGVQRIANINNNALPVSFNNVTMAAVTTASTAAFNLSGGVSNFTLNNAVFSGALANCWAINASAGNYDNVVINNIANSGSAMMGVANFVDTKSFNNFTLANSQVGPAAIGFNNIVKITSAQLDAHNMLFTGNHVNVTSNAQPIIALYSAGTTGNGAQIDGLTMTNNIFFHYQFVLGVLSAPNAIAPTLKNILIANNVLDTANVSGRAIISSNVTGSFENITITGNSNITPSAHIIVTQNATGGTWKNINLEVAGTHAGNGYAAFRANNVSDVTVSTLNISGPNIYNMIEISNSTNLVIQDVVLGNGNTSGSYVYIHDNTTVPVVGTRNVTIDNIALGGGARSWSFYTINTKSSSITNIKSLDGRKLPASHIEGITTVPDANIFSGDINSMPTMLSLELVGINNLSVSNIILRPPVQGGIASGYAIYLRESGANYCRDILLDNIDIGGSPSKGINITQNNLPASNIRGTNLTMFGSQNASFSINTADFAGIKINNMSTKRSSVEYNMYIADISIAAAVDLVDISDSKSAFIKVVKNGSIAKFGGIAVHGNSENISITSNVANDIDYFRLFDMTSPSVSLSNLQVNSTTSGAAVEINNVKNYSTTGLTILGTPQIALAITGASSGISLDSITINASPQGTALSFDGLTADAQNVNITNAAINGAVATAIQISGGSMGISISNITPIQGGALGAISIFDSGGASSAIQITNSPSNATQFGASQISNSKNVVLTNMRISGSNAGGALLSIDGGSSAISLINSTIATKSLAEYGLNIGASQGVVVSNLMIDGPINGMQISNGAKDAIVNYLTVTNVSGSGIVLNNAQNVQINNVVNVDGATKLGTGLQISGNSTGLISGISLINVSQAAYIFDNTTNFTINDINIASTTYTGSAALIRLGLVGSSVPIPNVSNLTIDGGTIGNIGNGNLIGNFSSNLQGSSISNITIANITSMGSKNFFVFDVGTASVSNIVIQDCVVSGAVEGLIKMNASSTTASSVVSGITVSGGSFYGVANTGAVTISGTMSTVQDIKIDHVALSNSLYVFSNISNSPTNRLDVINNIITNVPTIATTNKIINNVNISSNVITDKVTTSVLSIFGYSGGQSASGVKINVGSAVATGIDISGCQNLTISSPVVVTGGIGMRVANNSSGIKINNADITADAIFLLQQNAGVVDNVAISNPSVSAGTTLATLNNSSYSTITGVVPKVPGSILGGIGFVNVTNASVNAAAPTSMQYLILDSTATVAFNNFSINSSSQTAPAMTINNIIGFDISNLHIRGTAKTGLLISGSKDIIGTNVIVESSDIGIQLSDIQFTYLNTPFVRIDNLTLSTKERAVVLENANYITINNLLPQAGSTIGGISLTNSQFASISSTSALQLNYLEIDNSTNRSLPANYSIVSHRQDGAALTFANITDLSPFNNLTIAGTAHTGLLLRGTVNNIVMNNITIQSSVVGIEIDSVSTTQNTGSYNVNINGIAMNAIVDSINIHDSKNIYISNIRSSLPAGTSLGGVALERTNTVTLMAQSTIEIQYLTLSDAVKTVLFSLSSVASSRNGPAMTLNNVDTLDLGNLIIKGTAETALLITGASKNITGSNLNLQSSKNGIVIRDLTGTPTANNVQFTGVALNAIDNAVVVHNANKVVITGLTNSGLGTLGGIDVTNSNFVTVTTALPSLAINYLTIDNSYNRTISQTFVINSHRTDGAALTLRNIQDIAPFNNYTISGTAKIGVNLLGDCRNISFNTLNVSAVESAVIIDGANNASNTVSVSTLITNAPTDSVIVRNSAAVTISNVQKAAGVTGSIGGVELSNVTNTNVSAVSGKTSVQYITLDTPTSSSINNFVIDSNYDGVAMTLNNVNGMDLGTLVISGTATTGLKISGPNTKNITAASLNISAKDTSLLLDGLSNAGTNVSITSLTLGQTNNAIVVSNGSRGITINSVLSSAAAGSILISDSGVGVANNISITAATASAFNTSSITNSSGVTLTGVIVDSSDPVALGIINSSYISLVNPSIKGTSTTGILVDNGNQISATGVNIYGITGGSFSIKTASTPGILVSGISYDMPTSSNRNLSIVNTAFNNANAGITVTNSQFIDITNSTLPDITKITSLIIGDATNACKNITITAASSMNANQIIVRNSSNIAFDKVSVNTGMTTGNAVDITDVNTMNFGDNFTVIGGSVPVALQISGALSTNITANNMSLQPAATGTSLILTGLTNVSPNNIKISGLTLKDTTTGISILSGSGGIDISNVTLLAGGTAMGKIIITNSGSAAAPIKITNQPANISAFKSSVLTTANYITLDTLRWYETSTTVFPLQILTDSSFITLNNPVFTGTAGYHAINIASSTDIDISNMTVMNGGRVFDIKTGSDRINVNGLIFNGVSDNNYLIRLNASGTATDTGNIDNQGNPVYDYGINVRNVSNIPGAMRLGYLLDLSNSSINVDGAVLKQFVQFANVAGQTAATSLSFKNIDMTYTGGNSVTVIANNNTIYNLMVDNFTTSSIGADGWRAFTNGSLSNVSLNNIQCKSGQYYLFVGASGRDISITNSNIKTSNSTVQILGDMVNLTLDNNILDNPGEAANFDGHSIDGLRITNNIIVSGSYVTTDINITSAKATMSNILISGNTFQKLFFGVFASASGADISNVTIENNTYTDQSTSPIITFNYTTQRASSPGIWDNIVINEVLVDTVPPAVFFAIDTQLPGHTINNLQINTNNDIGVLFQQRNESNIIFNNPVINMPSTSRAFVFDNVNRTPTAGQRNVTINNAVIKGPTVAFDIQYSKYITINNPTSLLPTETGADNIGTLMITNSVGTTSDNIILSSTNDAVWGSAQITGSKGIRVTGTSFAGTSSDNASLSMLNNTQDIVLSGAKISGNAINGILIDNSKNISGSDIEFFGVAGGSFDIGTTLVPNIKVTDVSPSAPRSSGNNIKFDHIISNVAVGDSIAITNSTSIAITNISKDPGISALAGILIQNNSNNISIDVANATDVGALVLKNMDNPTLTLTNFKIVGYGVNAFTLDTMRNYVIPTTISVGGGAGTMVNIVNSSNISTADLNILGVTGSLAISTTAVPGIQITGFQNPRLSPSDYNVKVSGSVLDNTASTSAINISNSKNIRVVNPVATAAGSVIVGDSSYVNIDVPFAVSSMDLYGSDHIIVNNGSVSAPVIVDSRGSANDALTITDVNTATFADGLNILSDKIGLNILGASTHITSSKAIDIKAVTSSISISGLSVNSGGLNVSFDAITLNSAPIIITDSRAISLTNITGTTLGALSITNSGDLTGRITISQVLSSAPFAGIVSTNSSYLTFTDVQSNISGASAIKLVGGSNATLNNITVGGGANIGLELSMNTVTINTITVNSSVTGIEVDGASKLVANNINLVGVSGVGIKLVGALGTTITNVNAGAMAVKFATGISIDGNSTGLINTINFTGITGTAIKVLNNTTAFAINNLNLITPALIGNYVVQVSPDNVSTNPALSVSNFTINGGTIGAIGSGKYIFGNTIAGGGISVSNITIQNLTSIGSGSIVNLDAAAVKTLNVKLLNNTVTRVGNVVMVNAGDPAAIANSFINTITVDGASYTAASPNTSYIINVSGSFNSITNLTVSPETVVIDFKGDINEP